jgi:hypothetical protein
MCIRDRLIIAAVKGYKFSFSKKEGKIEEVNTREGKVSFSGGPVAAGAESKVTDVKWEKNEEGDFVIDIWFDGYPRHAKWILHTNGLLYFEALEMVENFSNIDFLGISFYYPEEKVKGIKWMGQGPYRVWKNRLKGSNFGIWQKDYNNTITGESYNNLVYPEFKGYHGKMYWLTLQTLESDFTILTETPNLFFQLYQPVKPKHVAGGTHPPFPDGDLSFLYEIPAIGTKFKQVEAIGPGSRKGNFYTHKGGTHYPLKLWFDFRNK